MGTLGEKAEESFRSLSVSMSIQGSLWNGFELYFMKNILILTLPNESCQTDVPSDVYVDIAAADRVLSVIIPQYD